MIEVYGQRILFCTMPPQRINGLKIHLKRMNPKNPKNKKSVISVREPNG